MRELHSVVGLPAGYWNGEMLRRRRHLRSLHQAGDASGAPTCCRSQKGALGAKGPLPASGFTPSLLKYCCGDLGGGGAKLGRKKVWVKVRLPEGMLRAAHFVHARQQGLRLPSLLRR